MYLNRIDGIGAIIIDEEEYRKDREIQRMVQEFRMYGITIRGMNYTPNQEENLTRVLNTISFTPSELSSGIQLADVCSRATWTHFERDKSDRYNQLSGFWDRTEYRVYEPSIVPAP